MKKSEYTHTNHDELRREVLQWLGPKIRRRMEELDITLSKLSRITGIGISTISDYISGRYEPSLSKIISLGKALEVEHGFFFEENFLVRGRVIADGLISYWTFDQDNIENDIIKDLWRHSDAKIIGNPNIVKGRYGEAIEFNGGSNFIQFDDSKMPSGNDPRTISTWVNLEEAPLSYKFGSVVEWGTNEVSQRCGVIITANQRVYFVGQYTDMSSNVSIEIGSWNHIAITYNGDIMKIYINGKLDREGSPGWGGKAIKLDTKLDKGRIGQNIRDDEPFPGIIDEVAIYNRDLSEDEVKKNYDPQNSLSR